MWVNAKKATPGYIICNPDKNISPIIRKLKAFFNNLLSFLSKLSSYCIILVIININMIDKQHVFKTY